MTMKSILFLFVKISPPHNALSLLCLIQAASWRGTRPFPWCSLCGCLLPSGQHYPSWAGATMTMSPWEHAAPWTTPGGTGEAGEAASNLPSMGMLALSSYDKVVPAENPNWEIPTFVRKKSQLLSHDVHLQADTGAEESPF